MKIQLIPLVLAIILTVTIANLFYYPWTGSSPSNLLTTKEWWRFADPISTSQCPLRGFKCSSLQDCNCERLCGDAYEAFEVKKDDNIVVMDKKMEPGFYCLPKGVDKCDQNTSKSIYSLSGWLCISKNESIYRDGKMIACKSDFAENNEANVLWDYLEGKKASAHVENYYELTQNAYRSYRNRKNNASNLYEKMRYRCKCDSLDKWGNRMVNTLPFVCSVDYCMTQIPRRPALGWNGKECECGPFLHADPFDKTSPCMMELTRLENDTLHGRVECTTDKALELKAWYCPPGKDGFVSFETKMATPHNPVDFVKTCLKS